MLAGELVFLEARLKSMTTSRLSTESGVDTLKPCVSSFVTCFHYELLGTALVPDPGQRVL